MPFEADSLKLNIDERGVATLTLNRPELHNAFDDKLIAELSEAFAHIDTNPDVRALVLASTGKSFCAGADLNWMRRMASYSYEENLRDAGGLAEMLRRLNFLRVPTLARVQGAAFGGGVGLVSCCDMAVASAEGKFCLSEVKLGLIPATISPYVIKAIGERAARRYFTTAEVISAQTALHLGLISELVEEDQLDTTLENLLKNVLRNGPAAVAAAKGLVLDYDSQTIDDALIADSSQRIAEIRGSDEGREGLSAFLEKRKPSWIM